jgi:hypothetical protein
MTVLKSDANGADAYGDPLRDRMDLVQRGTLSGEGTCDFVDQDDAQALCASEPKTRAVCNSAYLRPTIPP